MYMIKLHVTIFARVIFCKKPYFKYIASIKFVKFYQKNILPAAVFFRMKFKKSVYKAK